ncbi:hypothetical protein ACOME3_009679 [Neoechinorhynchus agilis]
MEYFKCVDEFVAASGGQRSISKILIANNGIAAVKCMRSIRKWCYETFQNEHAITFVAMVTPEDMRANAEYIRMADHVVNVPGGPNNNNYANCELIVDIAKRVPVDGVWAGWGHASENPKLAEMLASNDISFIGPPHGAMWALGDKVASCIIAQTAGVPTLPWSGLGIKLAQSDDEKDNLISNVPDTLYASACVRTAAEGLRASHKIGFPVMIKASCGGGGKGIRKVVLEEDFDHLFRQVEAEAPGSPIFIMKFASASRHLEVQVLCDFYGNAVSLYGRDCSVQRRHQKIIEEAPVCIAPDAMCKQMEKAALDLARMVGYVSAGTVEYLYCPTSNQFYFLELNPRLQVEHPCTEMIAIVNIPACQIQIAMGIPLNRIKDIRLLYGESPWGESHIDFDDWSIKRPSKGHAIAARITSENPDEGFKPSSGSVDDINFRSNRNVWGYFSVSSCGGLHEYADSQFGHIFSWGETREEARQNLVIALKELSIRGDLVTTIEYLIKLLEMKDFVCGQTDTNWLDSLIAAAGHTKQQQSAAALEDSAVVDESNSQSNLLYATLAAVHVAEGQLQSKWSACCTTLTKGQVPHLGCACPTCEVELIYQNQTFYLNLTKTAPTSYCVEVNKSSCNVDVNRMSDGGLLINYWERCYASYLHEGIDNYRLFVGTHSIMFNKRLDPSVLRAPSPGKITRHLVQDGEEVKEGVDYIEMEIMKLVMSIKCPRSGRIHFQVRPGTSVHMGAVLARLVFEGDNKFSRSLRNFEGKFKVRSENQLALKGTKAHQLFHSAVECLSNILDGYTYPPDAIESVLKANIDLIVDNIDNPSLPLLELQELISQVSGRIPLAMEEELKSLMSAYYSNLTSVFASFPGQKILNIIHGYKSKAEFSGNYRDWIQGAIDLVAKYREGVRGHVRLIIHNLLDKYWNVERLFQSGLYEKSVTEIREKYKNDMEKVTSIIFSRSNYTAKNMLVLQLINKLVSKDSTFVDEFKDLFQHFSSLNSATNSEVALRVRQLLIGLDQVPFELRYNQMESLFIEAVDMYGHEICRNVLEKMIVSEASIFELLHSFFYHSNSRVRQAALEVYIRRAYCAYEINGIQHNVIPTTTTMQASTTLGLKKRNMNPPSVMFSLLLPSTHPSRSKSGSTYIYTPLTKSAISGMFPEIILSSQLLCERIGVLCAFESWESERIIISVKMSFHDVLKTFSTLTVFPLSQTVNTGYIETNKQHRRSSSSSVLSSFMNPSSKDQINILQIFFRDDDGIMQHKVNTSRIMQEFVNEIKGSLVKHGIRRLTFSYAKSGQLPLFSTYRLRDNYAEDKIYRNFEPALAFQLEIFRMNSYDLEQMPTSSYKVHIYTGKVKVRSSIRFPSGECRYFVRCLVRHSDLMTRQASIEYLAKEAERTLFQAMNELEIAQAKASSLSSSTPKDYCNHIFMCFVPLVYIDVQRLKSTIWSIVMRYGASLLRLRVLQAELKMVIKESEGPNIPLRILINNDSGYSLDISIYKEKHDPKTGQTVFESFGDRIGPWHGKCLSAPYVMIDHVQHKRCMAQRLGTTYVYDFPEIFKLAVLQNVSNPSSAEVSSLIEPGMDGGFSPCGVSTTLSSEQISPEFAKSVFRCTELVLDDSTNELKEVDRQPGNNSDIGMVAWRITYVWYNCWREIIVIANDVTVRIGSFGTREDALFYAASRFARRLKIPRVYISANSGARIGLADEVKSRFKVAWNDSLDPSKGFRYLYLTPDDMNEINALDSSENVDSETSFLSKFVDVRKIKDQNEIRFEILSIIGRQKNLGVENLCGSGLIAGHEVYTSNNQLGGTSIMFNNGVSHAVVPNDLLGVQKILKWISYTPCTMIEPLPITIAFNDIIDRVVETMPSRCPYDPRPVLAGTQELPGFFDKNSFDEIMTDWAKTVVTARASLGGIPVGVIAAETRNVEVEYPADPADNESTSRRIQQAGQVWFPDSAYKTAEAIEIFNRERLPLFIFANWRGFSGGMKDMYDQVLKYGAMIVDGLTKYKQPVICYILPFGELRGGAWAVLDSAINPEQIEMYADAESRGGVLEPEGTVQVKFKFNDLKSLQERLTAYEHNVERQKLAARCRNISVSRSVAPDDVVVGTTINDSSVSGPVPTTVTCDESYLVPEKRIMTKDEIEHYYTPVALAFADLHDRPQRMLKVGAIKRIVKWVESRSVFYWRLKRLLHENTILNKMERIAAGSNRREMSRKLLHQWMADDNGLRLDNDKVVAEWFDSERGKKFIEETLSRLRSNYFIEIIEQIICSSNDDVKTRIAEFISKR